ncbi:hypothetical protein ACSBM8_07425 [Sphingomonas sp. ASY06-1R]|uniref:hypothetical protein n=1 Tax=Sphingomonas sp. ASY06-1R TaxID=3445771 RepID=UPI003FA338CC
MHRSEALLRNLCDIYGIPFNITEEHPDIALKAMIAAYSIPLLRSIDARVRYGNEILGALGRFYYAFSPMVVRFGQVLVMMEQFPYQFQDLHLSTEQLVTKFKCLRTQNNYLKFFGLVGGAGALQAAGAEYIKNRSAVAAAQKFAMRAMTGPIGEAASARLAAAGATGAATVGGSIVLAGATLAYYSGEQEKAKISAILRNRFQSGQMTDDQFREVFDAQIQPGALKKYWEFR